MRSSSILGIVCAGCVAVLAGCTSARMVESDRDNALKLIQEKGLRGYEIVRESEVVTGQQTHPSTRTDTEPAPPLMLGGSAGDSTKKQQGGERRLGKPSRPPQAPPRPTT